MKSLVYLIVISFLTLTSTLSFAQTTVTGHVFAEVVESVSASSQAQTSLSFQQNHSGQINFGQIDIKSAPSASCSLILGKANLTGNGQKNISMETSAYSNLCMQGNAINGVQSISLQCRPDIGMLNQGAAQYQGDVNIVLAYN